MKDHTRRCIAFISGSIISEKNSSSVYDYKDSSYHNFSSINDYSNISTYDYERGCFITGNGNDGYSLYHYGNSNFISLTINGDQFSGYDYQTSSHFSGTVNGNSISLYDYENSTYFNYTI